MTDEEFNQITIKASLLNEAVKEMEDLSEGTDILGRITVWGTIFEVSLVEMKLNYHVKKFVSFDNISDGNINILKRHVTEAFDMMNHYHRQRSAKRVRDILSDHLGVEHKAVTPTARLVEELGADSLDMVELAMAFEEEFSIEIPDDDASAIVTVLDVCDYIERRIGE